MTLFWGSHSTMDVVDRISEARKLQKLGLYDEAAKLFQEELCVRPNDIQLVTEVVILKIAQGLIGDAYKLFIEAEGNVDRDGAQDHQVALFDILRASVEGMFTAKMREPLQRAIDIFDRHLFDQAVESYDETRVMQL